MRGLNHVDSGASRQVAPVYMSTRELQLTFFNTGVEETSRAFGRRPRAPKKLKKLNSYTRFCEELC